MEKSLFSQAGEIKGKQREGYFTLFFQHSPSEENLKELRGSLFSVLEIKADSREQAQTEANRFFTGFRNTYYQASGNNLKALDEALTFFESLRRQQNAQVEIVVAVLWGSVAYIGKVGDGSVVLIRNGEAKKIDFSTVASGALADEDDLLLLDSEFSKEDLDILSGVVKQDFEESLRAIEETRKEKNGSALCIRLTIQEPIEKAETLLIADLDKSGSGEQLGKFEGPNLFAFLAPLVSSLRERANEYLPKAKQVMRKAAAATKEKAKEGLDNILEPWKSRKPGDIDDGKIRKKKRIVQIVVLLALVLIISVVVGVVNSKISQNKQNLEGGISLVQNNFEEAEKLKEINPAKAAELVLEAEEKLNSLPDDNKQVLELKSKLKQLLAEINKIYKVEVSEFVDLTLVKGNIQSKMIRLLGNDIFVLDVGTGSVVKVALKGGDPQIFVAEKIGLQNIGLNNKFLYLQINDAIKRIDLASKEEKGAASSSPSWKKIIDATLFSDNFYLLDSEAGQIWKYTSAGDGLSGPQNYFPVRFEHTPTAFAIDGAIYISSERDIFKFVSGKKQDFQIKNLPRAFGKIVDLYTQQKSSNLYVLDKENGSIVVISKDLGEYKGIYESELIKESDSFVVDEKNKTVYFLVGNTIHQINLK